MAPRHAALCMATGTGKTAVSAACMRQRARAAPQGAGAGAARRRPRYLVLAPLLSLLDQWDANLRREGLSTLLVGSDHRP